MPPALLPEVRYGAFFQYSPRGTSDVERDSRRLRDAVKSYHPHEMGALMDRLKSEIPRGPLGDLFTDSAVVVPAPRSAPTLKDGLWPAMKLCSDLKQRGIAREIHPLLERTTAVPKSAFAAPGQRPNAQKHFDTIRLKASATMFAPAQSIIVVDDFVTKGAMLLACVSRLVDAYPNANVSGFALVRTMSFETVTHLVAPVVGKITLQYGATSREP